MRVLISSCSSFWLSRKAVVRARELGAKWAAPKHLALTEEPEHFAYGKEKERDWEDYYTLPDELPRHDPILLQVYDELGGEEMFGGHWEDRDRVNCVEVPDDVTYYIGSYTGEWVAEQHRVWEGRGDDGRFAGTFAFTKDSTFVPLRG